MNVIGVPSGWSVTGSAGETFEIANALLELDASARPPAPTWTAAVPTFTRLTVTDVVAPEGTLKKPMGFGS